MRSKARIIILVAALAVGTFVALTAFDAPDKPQITVYKSPACGCCKRWVSHLEESGFDVKPVDTNEMSVIKEKYGLPEALMACHTALVNGYVVEGHVPPADILRLLKEKPAIAGIAVPGMPMGSPGMEGNRVDHYDVIAFEKDGRQSVFASH